MSVHNTIVGANMHIGFDATKLVRQNQIMEHMHVTQRISRETLDSFLKADLSTHMPDNTPDHKDYYLSKIELVSATNVHRPSLVIITDGHHERSMHTGDVVKDGDETTLVCGGARAFYPTRGADHEGVVVLPSGHTVQRIDTVVPIRCPSAMMLRAREEIKPDWTEAARIEEVIYPDGTVHAYIPIYNGTERTTPFNILARNDTIGICDAGNVPSDATHIALNGIQLQSWLEQIHGLSPAAHMDGINIALKCLGNEHERSMWARQALLNDAPLPITTLTVRFHWTHYTKDAPHSHRTGHTAMTTSLFLHRKGEFPKERQAVHVRDCEQEIREKYVENGDGSWSPRHNPGIRLPTRPNRFQMLTSTDYSAAKVGLRKHTPFEETEKMVKGDTVQARVHTEKQPTFGRKPEQVKRNPEEAPTVW